MNPQTLHEELTQLLMDNGASVSKASIDALITWLANHHQSIHDKQVRDVEQMHSELQRRTVLAPTINNKDRV